MFSGRSSRARSRAKRSGESWVAAEPPCDSARTALATRISRAAASPGVRPSRMASRPANSTMASSSSRPVTRAASNRPLAMSSNDSRGCSVPAVSGGPADWAAVTAIETRPSFSGRARRITRTCRSSGPARRSTTGPRRTPSSAQLSMASISGWSSAWNMCGQTLPVRLASLWPMTFCAAPSARRTRPLCSSTRRSALAKAKPRRRRGSMDKSAIPQETEPARSGEAGMTGLKEPFRRKDDGPLFGRPPCDILTYDRNGRFCEREHLANLEQRAYALRVFHRSLGRGARSADRATGIMG